MSRWFRMYDEILDDPKAQLLPPADFKAWVNLLCLASKNDGKLPSIADMAFRLRETENAIETLVERLLNGGLIDCRNGGPNGKHYAPHGWSERQYKSDTSTERVKRFRNNQRNASETGPEPETESDTEQSPQTPADGGHGSGHDVRALAQELCKRTGIGNAGQASIGQVGHWLSDGISASMIRTVVGEMAAKGGSTRSLKRFDAPIRRAHVERKLNGCANGRAYIPATIDELQRAIALADERGWLDQAAAHRATLAGLHHHQPTT
jgi:hypothetical protein